MISLTPPCNIDKFIGLKIKYLRLKAKISQKDLGQMIGLSFQQIQKYETGNNRISCRRLADIAQALGIPVSSFFHESPQPIKTKYLQAAEESYPLNPIDESQEDVTLLIKEFSTIKDQTIRSNIIALVHSIAKNSK
jgi:transcriptional regulator with XRE-family HTH domain